MKMSCFGSNTVWFCHVLLLDESEHPVEIRVSEQTFLSGSLKCSTFLF